MIMFAPARTWLKTVLLAFYAAVVGIVVGYASIGFLTAIDWSHELFIGVSGMALYPYLVDVSWLHLLLLSVMGALIVSLFVKYGDPEHRNHGPADVIYAARLGNNYLSIRAGLTSAFASILSIGCGASVGRYGPAVHLGATLGAWFAQLLNLAQDQRKTLLACGVAGAISASFTAPLAGVVFAHEVVIGRFGIKSVMPIVISSVIATTVPTFHELQSPLFILPNLPVEATWEYVLFAIVGATGGGLAVLFMASMRRFNLFAQQLPGSPLIRALLGGAFLGLITIIFPQTFGVGEQVIQDALMLEMTASVMVMLVCAKLLATSVSFAAGFSGGVFGPALYIGAMMGTAVGLGVNTLTEMASSPAVYGVAGMGAVIGRVIGAPIATILIVFELTGSYSLTTAVMVSVVVGGTVTKEFFNRSYFYHQLRERDIEPDESRIQQLLREFPISTFIVKAPIVLTNNATVAMARSALLNQGLAEAYVVDEKDRLLGQINAVKLLEINDQQLLTQSVISILSESPVVLQAHMNVFETFSSLQNFVGMSIPVIADGTSRQFVGVVYESKLMHAYLQVVEQSQQEEQ